MIQQAMSRNGLILAAFAIAVALAVGITEQQTRPLREDNQQNLQRAALQAVLPEGLHDNDLLNDTLITDDKQWLKLQAAQPVYIARLQQQVSAFILPARAPDGYGGAIELLVGISRDGKLTGVRITRHQETPGLGDAIDLRRSDWVLGFNGLSLQNPASEHWTVKKDGGYFDQFTGATITPRAVVQSVHNTLLFFAEQQQHLLQQAEQTQ